MSAQFDLQTIIDNSYGVPEVTAENAAGVAANVPMIDIRERDELTGIFGALDGVDHIPLSDLVHRLGDIPIDEPVLLICLSGGRSGHVASQLKMQGYDQIASVRGGMIAWNGHGLSRDQRARPKLLTQG